MLIALNKPCGVLCQFTATPAKRTLADLIPIPGVYPAGRLDFDSEGLVLLTDDGRLQHAIASPQAKLGKVYWAQVEGLPEDRDLVRLREGVVLRDGPSRPQAARRIGEPAGLWPRDPPIRTRLQIPTAWLEIVLSEGRNRQVRRTTAAAGFPTLRLIRWAIGPVDLGGLNLPSGAWKAIDAGLLGLSG